MANTTIDSADPILTIDGSEMLPASVGGTPARISVDQIKDFARSQLAGATAATGFDPETDKLFIIKDGELKPVSLDDLLGVEYSDQDIDDDDVSESDNKIILSNLKIISLGNLAEWLFHNGRLLNNLEEINLADYDAAATPLADSDLILVGRGSDDNYVNGKLTLSGLKDYVLGKLAAHVSSRTEVSTANLNDVVYILQGGSARKCPISKIAAAIGAGNVLGPSSTTENKIPQWDSVSNKLKDGLELVSVINTSTASGSKVPTAGAVKTAIESAIGGAGGNVKTSGNQQIAGEKTFAVSPIVPTPHDANENIDISDNSYKAASTEFVHAVVGALTLVDIHHYLIKAKSFSDNAVALDDCSVNVLSIAVGDTCTAYMPEAVSGHSRSFILVLTVTGSESGTATLNLSGGSFLGEAADTFTITPGKTHIIRFMEVAPSVANNVTTHNFRVWRRTFETTGTAFTGTIA